MDSTNAQAYVASTFQALTDAIVPSDSSHESHLAPDLHVYVIDGLNQYITIQQ
ncbi:hypothetical protein HUG15_15660 [Salicibibacter cibarius]|uniref:Uncharacterized protein n=1 Tax=Salicibibacter cibarius TaxID=2743000 RepID=A0A7T6Z524_9BACI|nr:hypothetical protein [Salicibibacter cibarius]QQK76857.1 hypothetical protein HUG15_15660 [Salicibibacter cibarius]